MSEEVFQALLGFFKALGDASRLRIVGMLAAEEASVQQLAAALDLGEPTVSHHLSRLRKIGLVSMRREGTVHIYSLETEQLEQLSRTVFTTEGLAAMTNATKPEAWREKVFTTFFDEDQRLRSIPTSRKKRKVILDFLAEQFEVGVLYPETEVNAVLKRHHEDCATLRRELVGGPWMTRERGVYQRPLQT